MCLEEIGDRGQPDFKTPDPSDADEGMLQCSICLAPPPAGSKFLQCELCEDYYCKDCEAPGMLLLDGSQPLRGCRVCHHDCLGKGDEAESLAIGGSDDEHGDEE